ncbi:MAG TPA: helix-turn-helix domain-containing protein [Candidatus Paceibacterota bacterium]
MIKDDLISIGEAASILGVSIDTLRRWDQKQKLTSVKSPGGHRNYYRSQIELFLNDLFGLAKEWVLKQTDLSPKFYCPNSAAFQTRLTEMQDVLSQTQESSAIFPLVVAVAGEIGNNSFDHNLGNWPDVPGIFFAYDTHKKVVMLADRGLGILATLKRVKPELNNDKKALEVAFTEILSGRAPESRGNGLKFVRKVVSENPIGLLFQTGDAELILAKDSADLNIGSITSPFRGCLALITF